MSKIKQKSLIGLLGKIASLLLTLALLIGVGYFYLVSQLPDVNALKDIQLQMPLRVYASDGQPLGEFGEIHRNPLTIDQIPKPLIAALLATEDQRFFEHDGIDYWGLLRAGFALVTTGAKLQGGSTITMQVARNFYLGREKTFTRKINEILLAMKIDRELSKQKILELYLNKIYLGKRAYGVDSAAHVYFGKPLNELSLPDLAMLAGLPKAPSLLNPVANPTLAKKRRNHVLARMYEVGYINEQTYKAAIATPLIASYHEQGGSATKAGYVAEMVRHLMVSSYGTDAYIKGYKVYTTIDSHLQQAANHAARSALLAYDQRHGYRGPEKNLGPYNEALVPSWQDQLKKISTVNGLLSAAVLTVADKSATALLASGEIITLPWQGLVWARPITAKGNLGPIPTRATTILKPGDIIRVYQHSDKNWQLAQLPQVEGALVALNPQDGAIKALIGGFDYYRSSFNRVTQAQRQPGSAFKPFIYAAALDKGFTLASLINDAPVVFMNPTTHTFWRPQNDDHRFRGPIRLRTALTWSINLISIRLLQAVGLPFAIEELSRFGFNIQKFPRNLTLALGSGSVTPLEMAVGYAILANGGYQVTPYLITRVTDAQDNTLYESKPKLACTECISGTLPAAEGIYAPQSISTQTAFLMTSALQDVVQYGTGQGAKALGRIDIAGKTGTTSDFIDTWFCGYNSDLVTVSWVGFDQPRSLHEYGAKAALPMWVSFMRAALADKPERTMPQPPGIVSIRIDPNTGLLANDDQNDSLFEYFTANTIPKESSSSGNYTVIDPMPDSEQNIEPLF